MSPQMYWRVPWAARLAERGFVVAMPQYRGAEESPFPSQVEDILTAIRFVRAHAGNYGIDPDRIVLMGGSAGAHIALLAAYAGNRFHAPDDDLSIPVNVNGVIDLYGPVDGRGMVPDGCSEEAAAASPTGKLAGGLDIRKHPEAIAPTIVANYIQKRRETAPHPDFARLSGRYRPIQSERAVGGHPGRGRAGRGFLPRGGRGARDARVLPARGY